MQQEPLQLRIRYVKRLGKRRVGDVITLPAVGARMLIDEGIAVLCRGEPIETPEGFRAEVTVERAEVGSWA